MEMRQACETLFGEHEGLRPRR